MKTIILTPVYLSAFVLLLALSSWQVNHSLQASLVSPAPVVSQPGSVDTAQDTSKDTPRASLQATREAVPVVQKEELPDLLPDFAAKPVAQRKNDFVAFVLPHVRQENERIRSIRSRLKGLLETDNWSAEDFQWLATTSKTYRLSYTAIDEYLVHRLLSRVDTLPPSLVLAQAAIESAWGTSRFARKANNIFGHWCMTPGCGIVPKERPLEASYEVYKFETIAQAVHRYYMNLNTNRAYEVLREIRACHREEGESLSGPVMAGGLLAYSGRGADYIDSLRHLIRANDWERMDQISSVQASSDCSAEMDAQNLDLAASDE